MRFLCLLPKIFPQLLPRCKCLRGDSRWAGFWPLLLARPGIFYLTGGLDRQALTHLTEGREGHTSRQPQQPRLSCCPLCTPYCPHARAIRNVHRLCLSPSPSTGWYVCSTDSHFCGKLLWITSWSHWSAATSPLLPVPWGMPALVWRHGTGMGLLMSQAAAARVSGVQSKHVGPFHNLPAPLSSIFTTSQQSALSIYIRKILLLILCNTTHMLLSKMELSPPFPLWVLARRSFCGNALASPALQAGT